jgi:hypothetical protein
MTNEAIDLFAAYATDEVVEETGKETVLPKCGNTKFKIARAFNPTYRRLLKKLWKPNEALIKAGGKEGEAKSIEIEIELMAKSILVGWQGAIRFQGENLEYSAANAKKLLAMKDFRAEVARYSEDPENYKVVSASEEDEKNSETTSTGTSDGVKS